MLGLGAGALLLAGSTAGITGHLFWFGLVILRVRAFASSRKYSPEPGADNRSIS